jgi:hypothetical protein
VTRELLSPRVHPVKATALVCRVCPSYAVEHGEPERSKTASNTAQQAHPRTQKPPAGLADGGSAALRDAPKTGDSGPRSTRFPGAIHDEVDGLRTCMARKPSSVTFYDSIGDVTRADSATATSHHHETRHVGGPHGDRTAVHQGR